MSRHTSPRMWPWAAALCLTVFVGVFMPTVDHHDAVAHTAAQADALRHAQAERRAQLAATDVCHRAFGPQTAPAEDVDGRLVCVDARGQRAQPARFAPTKSVQVATAQEARP